MSTWQQVCLGCGVGVMFAALASAETVVFQDNDFFDSDWRVVVYSTTDDGSVSGTHETTGGNPGAYRNVSNMLFSSLEPQAVYGLHLGRTSFIHDPNSQGEIESASFQIDFKDGGPQGYSQRLEPALRQNGQIYSLLTSIDTSAGSNWITSAQLDLQAEDFGWVNPCSLETNSNLHPDFSANGAPIAFGFATSTQLPFAIFSSVPVEACYDNFLWTIYLDPCRNRPLGDVNGDCRFDLLDSVLLTPHWLSCGLEPVSLCSQ